MINRSGQLLISGAIVAIFGMAAIGPAMAMPIDPETYSDIPGVDSNGRLDIRQVLDSATDMEVRLTRQIMLLQRQINDLQDQIDDLRDGEVE
jgi:hypothetical protein